MQGPHQYRRTFAVIFALATLICVLSVALFNYLIDPYAVFGGNTRVGLNSVKPRPDAMISDIKFIVGSRFQPDALILGNSRAEVGFDPGHPAFAARHLRGFNAAVPGTSMEDTADAFRRFATAANPRLAVVGIDFLDFLYSPDAPRRPPPPSPDAFAASTRTRLLALFSTTALSDSIKTLAIQRQQNPATLRFDGFNPLLDYREIAATEGYSALFRQRAQESARSLAKQPHNLYVGGDHTSSGFSALRSLLQIAGETGMEVDLVIYPYHLLLLLQYQEAGLWPLFEQWKADVAAISDGARQRGVRVSLWDFACPGAMTAETVPRDGDRRSTMQWYWEAGHFKKELGDRVLERIFEGKPGETDSFGVELTSANVGDRNSFCRKALAAMRDRFPPLAQQAADVSR